MQMKEIPNMFKAFLIEYRHKISHNLIFFLGLVSPSKQMLAKQLLENTSDYPALNMDSALDNLSPQPPSSRLQQQQPLQTLPPRSAKITMEEAAESAVTLSGPDQPARMPGASSRLPNGRPPAIQTGTT